MSNRLDNPERPGDVTTIWRDGEVIRRSPAGVLRRFPHVSPLPEADVRERHESNDELRGITAEDRRKERFAAMDERDQRGPGEREHRINAAGDQW